MKIALDTLVAVVKLASLIFAFGVMLYITQPGSPIQGSSLND